jgi:hypothetical protein
MRVPALPFHGSIGTDESEHEYPRTGFYAAVIPVAGVVCLGLWVLAIWKVVELIGGA